MAEKKKTTKAASAVAAKGASLKATKPATKSKATGKSLVVVESPAKAKTIVKYLGPQFTVMASLGHIKDLPKKNLSVNIERGFEPTYEVIPTKKKVISELRAAAKKVDIIYL